MPEGKKLLNRFNLSIKLRKFTQLYIVLILRVKTKSCSIFKLGQSKIK